MHFFPTISTKIIIISTILRQCRILGKIRCVSTPLCSANAKYDISLDIDHSGFEDMKNKGGTKVLDEVDWKIVAALQENARETYSEIGRRLNISHSTVHERVKGMEQCGIIKGRQL